MGLLKISTFETFRNHRLIRLLIVYNDNPDGEKSFIVNESIKWVYHFRYT